ncbi:MFS transporter [Aestuariimicrobium soli]|uniref:MFS transporter n=1 Tax=Aestuariimicrobium soli TaxID=2035834 RepID=UPI003EB95F8B
MTTRTDRPVTAPVSTVDEPRPSRRDWIGLGVLATALAMIVLDGTIVGVALPVIMGDLRLSLTTAQWVNSLYSVVFAALLLTAGRLGDRLGRRALLIAGVGIFVVGSVVAVLAPGATALLAARAVQGVGGALILPSTLSTVNATFRRRDRAAAFGVWGAVMSGAAAIGPLLGGWLTTAANWRWIFWVNVPIGVAVVAAAVVVVRESTGEGEGESAGRRASRRGFDLAGPVLSAVGFASLVFGLIEGNDLGWWAPKAALDLGLVNWGTGAPISAVPVSLAIGVIALVAFVLDQVRRERADRPRVLEVSLFSLPTFAWGNLTAGLVAAGEFALVFVLPLYLVTSLQLSTMGAGLVLAAMAAGAFVSGALARHLSAALGATRVVVLGLALELAGVALTALAVNGEAHQWWVAAALLPYGLGLGLASAQLTSTVLADVPVETSGTGSAVQSTVRQVGSALGSAIGGTALSMALGSATVGRASAADFAHASSAAVWVSGGVLALGLVAAVQVMRAADR